MINLFLNLFRRKKKPPTESRDNDEIFLCIGGLAAMPFSKQVLSKSPMLEALLTRWDNESAERDSNGFLVLNTDPEIFICIDDHLKTGHFDYNFESDE